VRKRGKGKTEVASEVGGGRGGRGRGWKGEKGCRMKWGMGGERGEVRRGKVDETCVEEG